MEENDVYQIMLCTPKKNTQFFFISTENFGEGFKLLNFGHF